MQERKKRNSPVIFPFIRASPEIQMEQLEIQGKMTGNYAFLLPSIRFRASRALFHIALYTLHFLAGMFPAAVAPKPEMGSVFYFLLEAAHVEFGELVVGVVLHVGSEALEVALIVATTRTGDMGEIEIGRAHV